MEKNYNGTQAEAYVTDQSLQGLPKRVFTVALDTRKSIIIVACILGVAVLFIAYGFIMEDRRSFLNGVFSTVAIAIIMLISIIDYMKKKKHPLQIILEDGAITIKHVRYLFSEIDSIYYTPIHASLSPRYMRRITIVKNGKSIGYAALGMADNNGKAHPLKYPDYALLISEIARYTEGQNVQLMEDLALQFIM
ncbi:hypothetical protein AwErysi_07550 [Erysipelotrichaceae bacterium]|nr:hypothetical protein AwErysi_07550 [Erysipelotrichaceae bacterium]